MSLIQKVDNVEFKFLQKEPKSSNDISFVYQNPSGEFVLIENGDRLLNTDFKKKKFTLRYSVSKRRKTFKHTYRLPSDNSIDEFDCSINFNVRIIDPIAYVKSDLDSGLEHNIREQVNTELRQMAKQFVIDKYSNLESAISKGLDVLDSLRDNGLEVEITPSVDISEEIRRKIRKRRDEIENKKHQRAMNEMEQKWQQEDRDKEFAEFKEIFAGTPAEGYIMMFNSVGELRTHLLSEYKDKRKTMESLKEKYFRGEIDEVQLRKAQNLFQGFDTLLGKMDQAQLESSRKQQYIEENDAPSVMDEEEGNSFAKAAKSIADQGVTDKGWS